MSSNQDTVAKIKGVAKSFFAVFAIGFGVKGLVMLVDACKKNDGSDIIMALLVIFVGISGAEIGAKLISGFAELLAKNAETETGTRSSEGKESGSVTQDAEKAAPESATDSGRSERLAKLLAQGVITEEEYKNLMNASKNDGEAV